MLTPSDTRSLSTVLPKTLLANLWRSISMRMRQGFRKSNASSHAPTARAMRDAWEEDYWTYRARIELGERLTASERNTYIMMAAKVHMRSSRACCRCYSAESC